MTCDGEVPVCCKKNNVTVCGGQCEGSPEYAVHRGKFEPEGKTYPGGTYHHTNPMVVMLAVDYNGNGIRDYGEPLPINNAERFQDTGKDGCLDAIEDGKGGCCTDADLAAGKCTRPYNKSTNPDPNKDNFDTLNNPLGTEGNWLYDDGEPYEDFGIDGVKADAGKGIPTDYGEGNGKFDYSPNFQNFLDHDLYQNLKKLIAEKGQDAMDRLNVFIDGGIRDIFNSGVVSYTMLGPLRSLGIDMKLYNHFFGYQSSIRPDITDDGDFLLEASKVDFSISKFGRNAMLLYGKPESTQREIDAGDGAHVGTPQQAVARFFMYFLYTTKRWPHADTRVYDEAGRVEQGWYYSKSLGGARRYSAFMPPGYDKPENKDKKYPVVYFGHGYGMSAEDMSSVTLVLQTYMSDGSMPKTIVIFPEGKCCWVNRKDGSRECGCSDTDRGSNRVCLYDDGREKLVPEADLQDRECNRGSFYLNMVSDKWGDPKNAAVMKYEDSVLDLIEHIDGKYRVRPPEDVPVKE
jgi:hypothetical protein